MELTLELNNEYCVDTLITKQDLRDKRMEAVSILNRMYDIIDEDLSGVPDWMQVRKLYQIRELRKEFLGVLNSIDTLNVPTKV